jgi:sulfur carrier protein
LNLIRVMPAEGSQRRNVHSFARSRFRTDYGSGFSVADNSIERFAIQLNGEPHTIDGDAHLPALIEKLKLRRGRVAVEINQVVIPKADWERTVLLPGDIVEVVNFVGGG